MKHYGYEKRLKMRMNKMNGKNNMNINYTERVFSAEISTITSSIGIPVNGGKIT